MQIQHVQKIQASRVRNRLRAESSLEGSKRCVLGLCPKELLKLCRKFGTDQ